MDIFRESTKRERIIKSIKLEALPHPATAKAMEEHKTKQQDDYLIERAKALEPAVTYAAKSIIEGGLKKANINFKHLFEIYSDIHYNSGMNYSTMDYKKEYDKIVKSVSKALMSYKLLNKTNASKLGDVEFWKETLPELVRNAKDIPDEEKTKYLSYLENSSGLATLMKKFLTTRITAISTLAPERVMENFEIYAGNIRSIKTFLDSPYAEGFLKDFPEFESFVIEDYYELRCLAPSDISCYNLAISGVVSENGVETKGYNAYINELNIKNSTDNTYAGPFFKKIKKLNSQILFPKEAAFKVETLENDDDVRALLRETFEKVSKKNLFDIVMLVKSADADSIAISGNSIHTFSHMTYGDHKQLSKIMVPVMEESLKKEISVLSEQKKTISDKEEKKALTKELNSLKKKLDNVPKYISEGTYTIKEIMDICNVPKIHGAYIDKLSDDYAAISGIMAAIDDSDIFQNGNLQGYHKNKMLLKDYTNALTDFRRDVMLIMEQRASEKGSVTFYNDMSEKTECLEVIKKAVNLIHNYMTRKTRNIAKEYPICLGSASRYASKWWNEDIENGLECKIKIGIDTIINMDGKYYYCVIGYGQSPFSFEYAKEGEEFYNVLNQKTSQDASKNFPKTLFSDAAAPYFEENPSATEFIWNGKTPVKITREHYRIYKDGLYTVTARNNGLVTQKQYEQNLAVMIELYKQFCLSNPHYSRYTFDFKETSEYRDMGEFTADANVCMVNPKWEHIKKEQIDELIESGHMYAFLITNRNMYKEDNVKTSYAEIFLELMSERNFETGQLRLNAKPNLTFRPACLPNTITHPKGSELVNKRTTDGKYIRADVYKEIYAYLNGRLEKNRLSREARHLLENGKIAHHTTDHDISRDARYKVDKYFISLSYVQNAKVSARAYNNITNETKEQMENGYRTLSVARGTKDLIYYMLFDVDHSLMEKGSLNVIGDVDFGAKLAALSKERNEGKADNWNYDMTVRNYKEWYLNAAIGQLIEIAVKNEAVIVIEEISDAYKDKYSCIDNQVFKAFEKKLEARLMDYHKKHDLSGDPGSLINPLQLTRSNASGMQNGILFKLSGAYTSNMDENGFVNLFDTADIRTQTDKAAFMRQFNSITYDKTSKLFTFDLDYRNFKTKRPAGKNVWTLYIGKPRTEYDREHHCYQYREYPAEEVAYIIESENCIEGNIAKSELSIQAYSKLYELFISSLKNTIVKECKENPTEYVNCLTSKSNAVKSVCEQRCENLERKLCFTVNTWANEEVKDYVGEWLKYVAA